MQNLYFSALLPKKFPKAFLKIQNALEKYNISFCLIENTKDIWCRDYMPIKIEKNKYVQFKYEPDYLKGYEYIKTNPLLLHKQLDIKPLVCNINIDGGNVVKNSKTAVMTDKIFSENPQFDRDDLVEKLKEILELDMLIIVPKQPYDMFGHSDSMVRFVDNKILVNDFSIESKSYNKKFFKVFEKYDLDYVQIKYSDEFLKKYTWGAYLNFIEVDNILFVPVYGIEEDEKVLKFFRKILPQKIIEPIEIPEIIDEGGALHCISWVR